jgi:FAD/FMN-containing dehydrogenase
MTVSGVDAHATLARGIVRLRLASGGEQALAGFDADDRRVVECGSNGWHGTRQAAQEVDAIAGRLRQAFDPHRILNRGIFGPEHA